MKSSFSKGLSKVASTFVKILLLALIVLAAGFGLVYPLWKWATLSPKTYTFFILLLLGGLLCCGLVRAFMKLGKREFFFRALKILILAGGIFLTLWLLFSLHRLFALLSLVGTVVLFVLLQAGKGSR